MYSPLHGSDRSSRHDPNPVDNSISHLLPESEIPPPEHPANETPPSGTLPVKHSGFIRTWLATNNDICPSGDSTDIKWGIHWYTPVSIVLLVIFGTLTAITHHWMYSSLDDQPVGDAFRQRWTMWIGSGLGFLTKVTLTAALGISRTQWVWLTLQKKLFTLNEIDSLFGIISDPTLFFGWATIREAKVASAMALAMWIIPLAAILTPGTLSVGEAVRVTSVNCTVPSLLFGFDTGSTATIPLWGNDAQVSEFWTWSDDYKGVGRTGSFMPAFRLTAYTGTITQLPDLPLANIPIPTTVGEQCGANCTYTIQFLGPAMTCGEFNGWNQTRWVDAKTFLRANATWSMRKPRSRNSFIIGIDLRGNGGRPNIVFDCRSTTGNYTVEHVIRDRKFREPVITKFEFVDLPDFEPYPIAPNEAYWPTWGLFDTIANLAEGKSENGRVADSEMINTAMHNDIYNNGTNVGNAIEQLAQRMIVSMIAYHEFYYWKSMVLDITAVQETQCNRTETIPVYLYSPLILLIVYGVAVGCALGTSVAGFIALEHNGMASTRQVSAIIRTSRNSTLDECIVGGDCLGGDAMSPELKKLKLRFGALQKGKGTAPFALGVKGEIYPIKRD